ncbi:hypothetical protein MFLAVUS_003938 [Mucor flavus]|uniref:Uncharacterized protein n=1 Tax=Mucor flavus TaxID=439312 RepID=A0ABP9YUL1_9FUNG
MDLRVVEYIEKLYSNISGLRFSRVFKLQSSQDAKREFYDATKSTSNRSLKTKNIDKDLILWASSSMIKLSKSTFIQSAVDLYCIQDEVEFTNEQLAENQKTREEDVEENYEEATEENLDDDFRMKFERSFNKMKAEEKWHLSNDKCVEDVTFFRHSIQQRK